ncbi:MAG TPA: exonuclease domain-containing protein, partial [Acidimicrobiales bacterium]|nr:exonuclease domain-containing protein [Acidimicrobiales bacterium]
IAVHGITTARARDEGCCLEEAAGRIHAAMRQAFAEGVPVVAMNASFDVTIAAELFRSWAMPPLSWEVLIDPLVMDRRVVAEREGKRHLEALCDYYGVTLENAHDAVADASAAVAVARQIGRYFDELGRLEAEELTVRQALWHRQWALRQDALLRQQELPGLAPEEFLWPCRLRPRAAVACAARSVTMRIP